MGEVVHLFMTGLGPVSPPVATGAAAPFRHPALVEHPFACLLVDQSTVPPASLGDLQMRSAELTPGAVGTYRVTVQLPDPVGMGPFASVECQGRDYYATGFLPVASKAAP